MKKLIISLVGLMLSCSAYAGIDSVALQATNTTAATVLTNSTGLSYVSKPADGYVFSIDIMVDAATTQDVAVVVVTNALRSAEQILYSNLAITASARVFPRLPVHNIDGIALGVTTNGYEPELLIQDKIELRAWNATSTNHPTRVKVGLWQ